MTAGIRSPGNPRGAGRKRGGSNSKRLNPAFRRDIYTLRLPRHIITWLQEQNESAGKLITDALVEKHGIVDPDVPRKLSDLNEVDLE